MIAHRNMYQKWVFQPPNKISVDSEFLFVFNFLRFFSSRSEWISRFSVLGGPIQAVRCVILGGFSDFPENRRTGTPNDSGKGVCDCRKDTGNEVFRSYKAKL